MLNEPTQCEHCGKCAVYGWELNCRACYRFIDFPNVRRAKQEQGVLDGRFEDAARRAEGNNLRLLFDELCVALSETYAVLTTRLGWARMFFERSDPLYGPYAGQVRAGTRAPADRKDDARRRAVDNCLYSGYGEHITYAALSSDGVGLASYGPVHLQLDSVAISHRSTVFEENSFSFTARLAIPTGEMVPEGHLSCWCERHKVGAVKLVEALEDATGRESFGQMILNSTGARESDQFLEVHIYGTFNHEAVEMVRVPGMPDDSDDEFDRRQLRRLVERAEAQWKDL